jgi:hypothetical protein
MPFSFITNPGYEVGSKDKINQNKFGAKRTALYDQSGTLLLLFDAVLVENHNFESDISEHPAEDGLQFADMQVIKPVDVSLQVIVSNYPLTTFQTLELSSFKQLGAGLAAGLVEKTAQQVGVSSPLLTQNRLAAIGTSLAVLDQFLDPEESRKDIEAFERLATYQQNSTRLILVTPFITYDNLLLKSIQVSKNKKSTESLIATLNFREVQIYTTQSQRSYDQRGTTDEINDKQTPNANLGPKESQASTDAQIAKTNKSPVKAIVDFFLGD